MDIIRLENVQFLCKKLISRPNLSLSQQNDIVYIADQLQLSGGAPYLFGVVDAVVSPYIV